MPRPYRVFGDGNPCSIGKHEKPTPESTPGPSPNSRWGLINVIHIHLAARAEPESLPSLESKTPGRATRG